MFNPLSGISLIAHLAVIGAGKFSDVLDRKIHHKQIDLFGSRTRLRSFAESATAIIICLALSFSMLSLFGIAVRTGIRQGSDGWVHLIERLSVTNLLAPSQDGAQLP